MDDATILATARLEAERMRALARGSERRGEVRMSMVHFGEIGDMLAEVIAVSERVSRRDEPAMGDTQYWVPLDHFQRIKARCDALERLVRQYAPGRLDLARIAGAEAASAGAVARAA
ncbi:MAG: hypothetical protein KGN34_10525 [Sphingomonadales bacterium]|nr:hypothetical protein [Sphingomonadales bacterium]